MEITERLLTPNKYSRPQTKLGKVKKIAVHYVGNAGSTAIANRNYFEGLKNGKGIYASCHYIIGLQGEIIRCIPESEIAYCTNSANGYSISIECCHPKADGKFNEATYNSLVELCVDIAQRYNLNPIEDIIRHYDVTGKKCPLYWVNNVNEYIVFKNKVAVKVEETKEMITEAVMKIGGKNKKVKRILSNGENYVRLRDLEELINIKYDAESKLVEVMNK